MLNQFCISVIVPVYNAESHMKKCLDSLSKQDFDKPFEILIIDDASTDGSMNIVKNYNIENLQTYSLKKNSGPSTARNIGLKKAKGKYIFFHDADDTLDENILSTLYNVAIDKDCDLVFCDRRYIENSQNQKNNLFSYPSDKCLENTDIISEMKKRFYNPLYLMGLFDFTGRLIRRSIIIDNKIFFEESLRYLEDETFSWCVLAYIKNAIYIRKQLCSYFAHTNSNTALSEGLNRGFNLLSFKLIKSCVEKSLKRRGVSDFEVKKISNQGFIFNIISALVSYSRSMVLGKVDKEKSIKVRKELISTIIADHDVKNSIKTYERSKKESYWIPKLIAWRSNKLLELACTSRAKEILRIRRKRKKL